MTLVMGTKSASATGEQREGERQTQAALDLMMLKVNSSLMHAELAGDDRSGTFVAC